MNQLLRILLCLTLCLASTSQLKADATPSYDDTLAKARKLMDDGKLAEAYLTASAAISLDDKRWEAYALVGLVLNAQGANADAKTYVKKALDRAPADKKATLQNIEKKISQPASNPAPAASGSELTGDARRKLDVLMLIAEDADKAKTADERQKLLREFLDKSGDFLQTNSDQLNVWLIRAAAAVELDEPKIGWEAGKKLKPLGADNSNDAKVRRVVAMLDRKGWLVNQPPPLNPRFDGVYQAEGTPVQGAPMNWNYLRFYEDGTVLNVASTGSPAEIAKWFKKETVNNIARGHYEVMDGKFVFSCTYSYGTIDYKGILQNGVLGVESHSQINGYQSSNSYKFIPVNQPDPLADQSPANPTQQTGVKITHERADAERTRLATQIERLSARVRKGQKQVTNWGNYIEACKKNNAASEPLEAFNGYAKAWQEFLAANAADLQAINLGLQTIEDSWRDPDNGPKAVNVPVQNKSEPKEWIEPADDGDWSLHRPGKIYKLDEHGRISSVTTLNNEN